MWFISGKPIGEIYKMKINKVALFTDIHWGKKSNSDQHNQDCLDYINWFCENVKSDKDIDGIIFLGDWFNNRSSIDVKTLTYSQKGAEILNSLGIPVYFIVGNHDLYYRKNREIYSVFKFNSLDNFVVINEPNVFNELGSGSFLSPYLFHHEYYSEEITSMFKSTKYSFGHFEFKSFIVSGSASIRMPSGPEPDDFSYQEHIFSGHFHKRQAHKNIVYIGNTFPLDFSDINDSERGMCTFDFNTNEVLFTDWEDCPKFIKTDLTQVLNILKEKDNKFFKPKTSVRCLMDKPISYEQNIRIKSLLKEKYKLRTFELEESPAIKESIEHTISNTDDVLSIQDTVLTMLGDIKSKHINADKLITIYKDLKRK